MPEICIGPKGRTVTYYSASTFTVSASCIDAVGSPLATNPLESFNPIKRRFFAQSEAGLDPLVACHARVPLSPGFSYNRNLHDAEFWNIFLFQVKFVILSHPQQILHSPKREFVVESIAMGIIADLTSLFSKFHTTRKEKHFRLEQLRAILEDGKTMLENPPKIGFDHTPKPDFQLDQIRDISATKGVLTERQIVIVKAARGSLFEVDRLIAETHDSKFARAADFRQRMPKLKDQALERIEAALKAIKKT